MCGGLLLLSEVDVPCAEMSEQRIQSDARCHGLALPSEDIQAESFRKNDIRRRDTKQIGKIHLFLGMPIQLFESSAQAASPFGACPPQELVGALVPTYSISGIDRRANTPCLASMAASQGAKISIEP